MLRRVVILAALAAGVLLAGGGCRSLLLRSPAATPPEPQAAASPTEQGVARQVGHVEEAVPQRGGDPPDGGAATAERSFPDDGASVATDEPDGGPAANQRRAGSLLSRGLDPIRGLWSDEAAVVDAATREAARDTYIEGEELFRQEQFSAAAAKFKSAAKQWPNSPLEEDALFMRAECYFFSDQYPKAIDLYNELLKQYINSRYLELVAARMFAVARYWEEAGRSNSLPSLVPNLFDKKRPLFDTSGNAVAAYASVFENDPTGPLADDSMLATANSYFVNERFFDADEYYSNLRAHHPNSEHQLMAHVLGLQAKLKKYQGPAYDGKTLAEAENLAKQTVTQFGSQLGEERQRVSQARQAVEAQQAERYWFMAEYWRQGKHHRAARFYYGLLLRDFPETKFAAMAREQLAEIDGLPPEPPQRFVWLSEMFGSKRR